MKVVHWSIKNGSGMHRVAESMVQGEQLLGIDSILVDPQAPDTFAVADDADIHVSHTHLPGVYEKVQKGQKVVWIGHGTPEHVFQTAVEEGLNKGYGHGDTWMLMQFWLQHSDAIVTFWSRHADFYRSICDKRTEVHVVPLGVDKEFWKPVASRGKFSGNPSLFTAENCHYIKWPLDLFVAWGYLSPEIPDAVLHASYLPKDQHRWFFPLINRNGASFASHVSSTVFDADGLRNAFCSVDYYIGLVRYGDHNKICFEAKASGCKVISYTGNPYADFWVREGDQRGLAKQLEEILRGEVEPREAMEVPSLDQMCDEMVKIYEEVLS